MKIGILTLPIKTNYGGVLQAYALLTTLKKLGYDAWFIKRRWNSERQSWLHKKQKAFTTLFSSGNSILLSIATYSLKQKSLTRKRKLRVC